MIADQLREFLGHLHITDRLVVPSTHHLNAYKYYLKGRYHFNKWNAKDTNLAIAAFQQAIALDPDMVQGHLGLADAYSFLAVAGFAPREEAWNQAQQALTKAQQLTPDHPGLNYLLAHQALFKAADFSAALGFALKALSSLPTFADAQRLVAFLYVLNGTFKSAKDHIFYAKSIDPLNPETLFYEAVLYYRMGQYATVLTDSNLQNLVIIPSDQLGHIPFETLLTHHSTNIINYKKLPYLLNRYAISYDYSAALWHNNQQSRQQNNQQLLAYAANYRPDSLLTVRPPQQQKLRKTLQPLPAAQKELEELEKFIDGIFYYKHHATEKTFKTKAADYGIIHLAMHGILDQKHPILSSLVFTENSDTTEDNFLQAYEISQLELNADLVVLSACETGYGKFQQGEGVMSLARSFMYAGTPAMIVSLWQVNDYCTAIIMQNLYQNLAEGMDKATALQKAKLDFIKTSNSTIGHPAYWAPFIQLGNRHPIQMRGEESYLWWIVVGISFLLLLMVIGVMRKRETA